jgi:glycosyltransferase A (GT-A) superfamily protein (DUF2064 family)
VSPTSPLAPPVMLVVAKAPVPGRVKTRLGATIGMERAAGLAAASLLDTLDACVTAYGADRCHLALDGDLTQAVRAEELLAAVAVWSVHPQRGDGLAERLLHAHLDVAAATGAPTVQVGMDTPQLTAASLVEAGELLRTPADAVLGPASDGGWWLLAVADAGLLAGLTDVPMSSDETGVETRSALVRAGADVHEVATLLDVDEERDAVAVAEAAPTTRFAAAWTSGARQEPTRTHEVSR